jgi:hypothetical protein
MLVVHVQVLFVHMFNICTMDSPILNGWGRRIQNIDIVVVHNFGHR